jgi:hypothetical protein
VRPLPGEIFKQFTARDVVSRWDVIQAHPRATACTAAQFQPCVSLPWVFLKRNLLNLPHAAT